MRYVTSDGVDITNVVRLHRKYHGTRMVCYMSRLHHERMELCLSGEAQGNLPVEDTPATDSQTSVLLVSKP